MEVLAPAAAAVPTKPHARCQQRKLTATDSAGTSGTDDVRLEFDASGDLRTACDVGAIAVPKHLLRQARQLQLLLQSEKSHMPRASYIQDLQQKHSGMTREWRKSLVDWVIEFMVALRYTTETYSLAINFMDRFFSKVTVDQNCMQTLAIACCLTASKVQAERPIRMAEIRAMFGSSVNIQHVKSVEVQLCSNLTFLLSPCVSQTFVYFFTSMIPDSEAEAIRNCALVAADLAMTDYTSLVHRPSVMGLAAVLCAYKVSGKSSASFLAALKASKLDVTPSESQVCVTYLTALVHRFYPDLCRADSPTTITGLSWSPSPSLSPLAPSPAPLARRSGVVQDGDGDGDVSME